MNTKVFLQANNEVLYGPIVITGDTHQAIHDLAFNLEFCMLL